MIVAFVDGIFPDELLLDRDEAGVFELRQMAGEISLAQSRKTLQEEKVGAFARGERGEESEARGLVRKRR